IGSIHICYYGFIPVNLIACLKDNHACSGFGKLPSHYASCYASTYYYYVRIIISHQDIPPLGASAQKPIVPRHCALGVTYPVAFQASMSSYVADFTPSEV